MQSEQILKKSYRLAANVEIGKFTCVSPDSGTYVDGFVNPAAANAACLGVAMESIIPNATADYSGGVYGLVSGTAWPSNSIPAAGTGLACAVAKAGIVRIVAAGAITRGDRVNIADTQGRVKTIDEVAGALVHEVGEAETASTQAGDIVRVRLTLIDRHA
jgi:hypothetical protein